MRILILSLALLGVFFISSCTKDTNKAPVKTDKKEVKKEVKKEEVNIPNAHCKQAVENVIVLMLNSPKMKEMSKEEFTKMKESFERQKEKRIKACAMKYDKESVNCAIKAKVMTDLAKCNPKPKKEEVKKEAK